MTRRRHTPEQIIRKLAEGHKLMAGGMSVEDVSRQFGIVGNVVDRAREGVVTRHMRPQLARNQQ